MPDTERSLAALQALLADQSTGAISPQDVRDLLVSAHPGPFLTLTNNSATPSVANGQRFKASNSSPTTITNLLGGFDGKQVVMILFTNGNTTFQHNTNIKLPGGVDFVGATDDVLLLVQEGTKWVCVGREINS